MYVLEDLEHRREVLLFGTQSLTPLVPGINRDEFEGHKDSSLDLDEGNVGELQSSAVRRKKEVLFKASE